MDGDMDEAKAISLQFRPMATMFLSFKFVFAMFGEGHIVIIHAELIFILIIGFMENVLGFLYVLVRK